jgi:hypothetical protein
MTMVRLNLVVGALLVLAYLVVSIRGVVFSGTDERPRPYASRSSGGGGIHFWGSGYSGGK